MTLKNFGTFLITVVLLAGTAWAEVKPGEESVPSDSGQVGVRGEMTVQPDQPPAGPADADAAEKAIAPAPDAASGEAAAESPAPAPAAEPATGTEGVSEPEAAPGTDAAVEEAAPEEDVEEVTIADPIEPWNRLMFHFNDKLYFWGLKPVARAYNAVVPEPVRVSVRNFFRNVTMPIRFVNCFLQGKMKGAGIELARFGINTTLGLAGFFDVALSKFELSAANEDLGQTLGYYGMDGLMYIVWPVIGPSTVRDTIGFAGDTFLNPVSFIDPAEAALGVKAYEQINKTSLEIGNYEDMKESALEPYTAIRDAYVQYRKKQIKR